MVRKEPTAAFVEMQNIEALQRQREDDQQDTHLAGELIMMLDMPYVDLASLWR